MVFQSQRSRPLHNRLPLCRWENKGLTLRLVQGSDGCMQAMMPVGSEARTGVITGRECEAVECTHIHLPSLAAPDDVVVSPYVWLADQQAVVTYISAESHSADEVRVACCKLTALGCCAPISLAPRAEISTLLGHIVSLTS